MSNEKSFEYTYSASEQDEIRAIMKKYGKNDEPKSNEETTLEELRKLDQSTTRPGLIAGLSVGIIGTLTLGGGMSMIMEGGNHLFYPGIVVGVVGMILALLAYPIYKKVTKKQKEKNVPKIMELSKKLLDENNRG